MDYDKTFTETNSVVEKRENVKKMMKKNVNRLKNRNFYDL